MKSGLTRRHLIAGLATCAATITLPIFRLRAAVDPELSGLVRLTGRVKWFDVARGYGFIAPDGDLITSDVLLHRVCLENSGYMEAPEGARVIVHAMRGPKAWQAFLLLSLDVSTATPAASRPSRLHRQVSEEEIAQLQARSKARLSWKG